jgi:hypothetical protein
MTTSEAVKMAVWCRDQNICAAFISHDWGDDELGRNTHTRVLQLQANLGNRGLTVLIDPKPFGDRSFLKHCNIIVACITQKYLDDSSKPDVDYTKYIPGPEAVIPVVMERRMSDMGSWKYNFGGSSSYVKMWDDDDLDGAGLEALVAAILKQVPSWRSSVENANARRGAEKARAAADLAKVAAQKAVATTLNAVAAAKEAREGTTVSMDRVAALR